MNLSTTYLLNVALHAAILSVFASLALLTMRQARHRSLTAIAGLLADGFLPWLTALRPGPPVVAPSAEIPIDVSALPIWTVATVPVQIEAPKPVEPVAVPANFSFPDPLETFVTLWATGACAGLLLLGIASLRVLSWRRSLKPLDETIWHKLQEIAPDDSARDHFLVFETTSSPCVTGLFRPRIVLPRFLFESASEEGLRWAARHETSHWQAGDSRWMILFALIRCANWWNPFVHQLIGKWAEAREQLCDLAATGDSRNRANYGEFLIAMARKISTQPPLSVAMAKRLQARRLKRRIVCLLESERDSGKPVGLSFIGVGTAFLIGGAVIISSLRIGAAETPDRPERVSNPGAVELPTAQNSKPETPPTQNPPAPGEPDLPKPPAAMGNARQFKIATKFTLTDSDHGFIDESRAEGFEMGSIFSDGQVQLMMRGISQKRGSALMTAPSVTAKSGQETSIEIIREVPRTAEQRAKRNPKVGVPFAGISLAITPRFSSERPPRQGVPGGPAEIVPHEGTIELEQTLDCRFIPGIYQPVLDSNGPFPQGLDPEKIQIVRRTIKGRMGSGMTVCSLVGEVEPGKFLTLFTRVDAIDREGRLLDENGKLVPKESLRVHSNPTSGRKIPDGKDLPPDALPSPQVKGKLRLNAILVEIPLRTPRPPGEGLVIGLTPSDPKVAAKITNDPRAKVRKLKTVEMPLNQQGTPWREFPELSVSAIASKNCKHISISSHAVGDEPGQFPNIWEEMPSGSTMNFGFKTNDTTTERRLLMTIEAVK